MKCPFCQSDINDNAAACEHCGRRFSPEELANSKFLSDYLQKRADNVKEADIEKALSSSKEKINKLKDQLPDVLKKLWDDILTMWSMLKDYYNRKYTEIPWHIIAAIVATLLYFVSPIDLIPDFIPGIGYCDDAAIVMLALKWIGSDLDRYKSWKASSVPLD